MRERDRKLARAREEALRDERSSRWERLSAGAAHELGTPLATIGMLAEDMARRHGSTSDLASDVVVLQEEIARARESSIRLTQATESMCGEGGAAQAADAFLERAFDRGNCCDRPACRRYWIEFSRRRCCWPTRHSSSVAQPVNNAADASPAGFEVSGHAGRRRGRH